MEILLRLIPSFCIFSLFNKAKAKIKNISNFFEKTLDKTALMCYYI